MEELNTLQKEGKLGSDILGKEFKDVYAAKTTSWLSKHPELKPKDEASPKGTTKIPKDEKNKLREEARSEVLEKLQKVQE